MKRYQFKDVQFTYDIMYNGHVAGGVNIMFRVWGKTKTALRRAVRLGIERERSLINSQP